MEKSLSATFKNARTALTFLFFGTLCLAKADLAHAVDCGVPGACFEAGSGISAGVGAALDESKSRLYFVEYTAGTLKTVDLPPQCGPGAAIPSCSATIKTIASGLVHPEDVQLDLPHGYAYVTTRDDAGTTGVLWKVTITTGAKTRVTFNLGAPQQLALDTSKNQAYTVGYDDGKLRKIDLTTGAKTPIVTNLGHPIGLAVTKDGTSAYVTEQDTNRISKIDLVLGVKNPAPVVTGLVSPFFLAWTDDSQNSLYVVQRDPANKVVRVELSTSAKNDAITNLPWRPSGIATGGNGSQVYAATDGKIEAINMMTPDLTQPVFLSVGRVPASKITNGYATTDPDFSYQVKDSPFGGTLDLFGNLNNFKAQGATYYEVSVSKDGGTYTSLNLGWNMYKWDPAQAESVLVPVAPSKTVIIAGTAHYLYSIPAEYPMNAGWWQPPFQVMRWPSGENGDYTFKIAIYDESGANITGKLPAAQNSLMVKIDNTPPNVTLSNICQKGVAGLPGNPCYPDKEVKPCDIVSSGPNTYFFKITAYDTNSHLLSYGLTALWGDNKSDSVFSDSYGNHLATAPSWSGVMNFNAPQYSQPRPLCGNDTHVWCAACKCAHTFYLGAWKRTIDGYNYLLYRDYHKSITINNAAGACQ
jgi:sugar lactone lactonase YvrE